MRDDIILAFCDGKKPIELINDKLASKKTIYYYHSIYSDMKEIIQSDIFVNGMIRLMIKLRIKDAQLDLDNRLKK
jgi:hypothetical protein